MDKEYTITKIMMFTKDNGIKGIVFKIAKENVHFNRKSGKKEG